jgi:hypothetical protein
LEQNVPDRWPRGFDPIEKAVEARRHLGLGVGVLA